MIRKDIKTTMAMKMRLITVAVLTGILFLGCGAANKIGIANADLDRLMDQEAFKIDIKSVEPQVTNALAQIGNSGLIQPGNTIGRIDVTGEGFFIKLEGQKVSANLPYYGERQMGGGYGSDTGIKFNETARTLKITKDEKKQRYKVAFNVDNAPESYFITIDLAGSLNGIVHVQSSQRNRIRFTGTVKDLKQQDIVTN